MTWKKGLKRTLLVISLVVIITVVVVIAFISPIAKYLVEKYDVKYLGREVKIGWLYLNPFTGYLHLGNLKVYEAKSDTLFFSADGVSVNYNLWKCLKKTYEITGITLTRPVGYIKQDHKQFNFSDLIERFTPKEKDTLHLKPPVHFNILDIVIKDGEFHYNEQSIPVNYFVKKVDIKSTGKRWNVDSVEVQFAFSSGPNSGDIKGTASLNLDSLRYRMDVGIEHFDLKLLEQYLKDMANYGHLSAMLDAHIKAEGSLKDQLDMIASGFVQVSDIHFGKRAGEDFAAIDKFVLQAVEINPREYEYVIDSIMIDHPFFKYEHYDHLDNIQKMFGEGGSRIKQANAESDAGKFNLIIEIAKFVKKIAINFTQSYYAIDKIAVYNGDIGFNDFALRDEFSVRATPLYFLADSLDKDFHRLNADVWAGIKPYGSFAAGISFNPNNYSTFDVRYKLVKIPVSMFNPYLVTYTSFPLDRGKLDFDGKMNVRDSQIVSENHLVIVDPRPAKRVKKKDTNWLPVPLIMSLVRGKGNAIDFELPIRGSLSDPKFKLWPAVMQVVKNIFVKPPSSAYLFHVKQVETEVEKSLTLKWQYRQTELRRREEKFVNKIVGFLKDNNNATISVTPMIYNDKEKEHILLFEAKKKFFLASRNMKAGDLSPEDSIVIDKMSVKDSLFMHYLNKQVGDTMIYTVQEKCAYTVTADQVNARYNRMLSDRERIFRNYFVGIGSQVVFKPAQATIPFNGFSYYKIDYKGELPKKLIEAYEELQELNEEPPREQYKAERGARRRGLITEEREAKRKKTTP